VTVVWILVPVLLVALAVPLFRGVRGVADEAARLLEALDALLSDARPALALLRTEEHRTRDRLATSRWGSDRVDG